MCKFFLSLPLHCQICSVIISLAGYHPTFLLFTYRVASTCTFALPTNPSFLISLLHRASRSSRSKSTCCWLFEPGCMSAFPLSKTTKLVLVLEACASNCFYVLLIDEFQLFFREVVKGKPSSFFSSPDCSVRHYWEHHSLFPVKHSMCCMYIP